MSAAGLVSAELGRMGSVELLLPSLDVLLRGLLSGLLRTSRCVEVTGGRLRSSSWLVEVVGLVFAELDLGRVLLVTGRDVSVKGDLETDRADSNCRVVGLLFPLRAGSWRDLSLCLLRYASVILRLSSSFRESSSMLSRLRPSRNPSS